MMKRKASRCSSFLYILIFFISVLLTSCATIKQEPFSAFTTSLQELTKGADEALKYNDTANRNRFIEETAIASTKREGEEAITNILIESIPGNPYAWKMDEVPLFMISPQFRSGVYTLNSTLVAYSELLIVLAGSDLISQKEFDSFAKDLNSNFNSAAIKLKLEGFEQSIGIFSVGASQAAHSYIDYKRRGKLREILEKNQPLIVDISSKLQIAIRNAVRNLRQNYDQQSFQLARQLVPNQSATLDERKRIVTSIVELNEDFLIRLNILEALSNSYRTLPSAHNELLNSIENPKDTLATIKVLYDHGKHMYDLYREIHELNTSGN